MNKILSIFIGVLMGLVFVLNDAQAVETSSVSLISPNGGEELVAGSTTQIKWSFAGPDSAQVKIDLVDMRYSFNMSPNPITTIANSVNINNLSTVSGQGMYNWAIPANITSNTHYGIAIYIIGVPNAVDASNNIFSITSSAANPSLSVSMSSDTVVFVSPGFGTNLEKFNFYANGTEDIKINSLTITRSGGSSDADFSNIKLFVDGNTQIGQTVSSFTSGKVAFSNLNLTIAKGYSKIITVRADVGFTFLSTSTVEIGINSASDISAVGSPSGAASPISGTFPLNVYTAAVVVPSIKVLSPNGGEILEIGKTYYIKWSAQGTWDSRGNRIIIQILKGGALLSGPEWAFIGLDLLSADGSYAWKVPSGLTPANDYSIKISSYDGGTYSDSSDGYFSIATSTTAAPSILVLSPNGGEMITISQPYTVKWKADNVTTTVNLAIKDAYSSTILETITGIANTGSYTWIPSTSKYNEGAQLKVSISAHDDTVRDDSDAYFKIVPLIKVLSPNGGEVLEVGKTYNIKWSSAGLEKVNIELLTESLTQAGSFGVLQIASDVNASDGSYSWVVPQKPNCLALSPCLNIHEYKNHLIEITSADYHSSSNVTGREDKSDAPFRITASTVPSSIKLLSPNGGEVLEVGKPYNIKWSSSNVKSVGFSIADAQGMVLASNLTNDINYDKQEATWVPRDEVIKAFPDVKSYKVLANGCQYADFNDCSYGPFVSDYSDNPFSLTSPQAATIPITPTPAPVEEGSLVKAPTSPTVYVIKNGKKVAIISPQEFEQAGYKWDQIKEVQADLLAQIAELKAQVKQLKAEIAKAGALLKSITGNDVYVIVDGKKEKIQDPETFNKRGYKWEHIQSVSQEELASIPDYTSTIQQATTATALPAGITAGSLVKSPDSPMVYFITSSGAKKPILNIKVFNSYNSKWENVKIVSKDELSNRPTVNVIRLSNDPKVYFISNGEKRWIKTPTAFEKQGLKWDQIVSVNETEFGEYQEGAEIE